MNKNDILQQLIERNNGYLLSAMAIENNISKAVLSKYVKDKSLDRIARGIYITDDVWPDELYIMQARNKAVIFSGETALYLHGLIDMEYSKICVSVPTGYNATHLKTGSVQIKYASKNSYELGVCTVPSMSGNMVKAYDRERCICDLISDRKKIEIQNFQTAMKGYMSGKGKNLSRLIEYAEKLGMRDEVMKYVEVFG
ncbi:MAG: type IV toxin-antitoxin system AbiEi family antitoxin domain-containing protein [Lachnospiraceae bacterium]|nr:type IV toxin-antitoxin system AbiEi family antitoxin domain-containing protein [Lachnospiraceae bacterium]